MSFSLSDYDYHLPPELVATHPVSPRDAAKLLVWPQQEHKIFRDLPDYFQSGDVLVLNTTKVIPARLRCMRPAREQRGSGGQNVAVELLLHRPQQDFAHWTAFAKPAKRLQTGDVVHFKDGVTATVTGREEAQVALRFDLSTDQVEAFLDVQGEVPLPPYLNRAEEGADKTEYQTVYAGADQAGSVAAPTAGLHFTPELLQKLQDKGVQIAHVTLHVGAGTFLPVNVDDIRAHKMHAEWGHVSAEAAAVIAAAKARGSKVTTVGTTSTRLLETAARQQGGFGAWQGETDIFLYPGSAFMIVDRLVTNFHLPKSTLLMLVAAFLGSVEAMQELYRVAIAEKYRFYSYGDACLLTRG